MEETIIRFYPTDPSTEKKAAAVAKFEPKTYYAEEAHKEMLELSDRHVLWRIDNVGDVDYYYYVCDAAKHKLSEHYHTEFGFYGRNGRHVCVPDTAANRRNYRHMVKAVKREQDRIINLFKEK